MKFGVVLGNRDEIFGEGVRRKVQLQLQGLEIIEDFLANSLGNLDFIFSF